MSEHITDEELDQMLAEAKQMIASFDEPEPEAVPETEAAPEPTPEPEAPEAAPEEHAEEEAEAPAPEKKKKKLLGKILYFGLIAVFLGVFIYCAVYIANYMVDSYQESSSYDELAALVDKNRNDSDGVDATLPSVFYDEDGEVIDTTGILPEYQAVYAQNQDMVGWITVPDTKIDYPVMQTPDNVDYYLNHNFEKKWSSWGCIYAREACDVFTPSDNVVLYGHHMKDKSMFAGLDKYKKKSFWEDHQYFTFDTLYEHHTYQVIAVFKTSAKLGQGFAYHVFNTASSEEEFNTFMETVHSLQMYDTGLTAEYGDMLLTLSTCEYTLDNGRFVVIAKRVS